MGPGPLEELVTAFARLPGIGRKTAQRLAFHMLRQPRAEAERLSAALLGAKDGIHPCARCFAYTDVERELCAICADARRDHT